MRNCVNARVALGFAMISAAACALPASASQEVAPPVSSDGWSQLMGSSSYTCGIRGDQSLWCWGSNYMGELGLGHYGGQESRPVRVGRASDWTDISGYDWTTCGVRGQGTLWCWGYNGEGQIGDGSELSRPSPERIGTATTWSTVDVGKQHTCATRTDGTLWCWGSNYRGALGDGTTIDHHVPEQVGAATNWSDVTSGWFFSCATRTDGTLWCWGAGSLGQLGNGGGSDQDAPVQVGDMTDWTAVDAGADHACGIRTQGSLWCWGNNKLGQLGVGRRTHGAYHPVAVQPASGWLSVSTHYKHTCASRVDQTAYCWGANGSGELGDGYGARKFRPQQVGGEGSWATVAAGGVHTCGTHLDGSAWCWGSNAYGELGDGTVEDSPYPVKVRRS